MSAGPEPSGLPGPQRNRAIVAISFGTALLAIDNAIASIALPSIARALDVSRPASVMVVTVYQMVLLMAVLPFSALGDRLGHRRVYQGGQALFLVATVLSVLAVNLPTLLVARACQALGVAGALSVSSALLRRIYPAERLGRGLGLNGIIIASGAALAPTLGGLLLSLGSWRWVFAAAAPFALLSLLLGRNLPDPPPTQKSWDGAGAILCAAMFGLSVAGLQSLAQSPSALSFLLLTAGAGVGFVFVRRELTRPAPILPVDLLARPVFALSIGAALLAFGGSMAFTLSLPFRLQQVYGFSPAEVGALMAAWPLTMLAMAPVAGAMADRAPRGLLGGVGMSLAAAGLVLMAFLPSDPHRIRLIAPLMLGGAGFGLFLAPNSHQIMSAAPHGRSASAGALISTTRLVGSALGATLLAALLALHLGDGAAPALVAGGCALAAAIFSLGNLRLHAREISAKNGKTSDG